MSVVNWDAYCGFIETYVFILLCVWFYLDRKDKK